MITRQRLASYLACFLAKPRLRSGGRSHCCVRRSHTAQLHHAVTPNHVRPIPRTSNVSALRPPKVRPLLTDELSFVSFGDEEVSSTRKHWRDPRPPGDRSYSLSERALREMYGVWSHQIFPRQFTRTLVSESVGEKWREGHRLFASDQQIDRYMHSDIERELRHRAQAIQTAEKDSGRWDLDSSTTAHIAIASMLMASYDVLKTRVVDHDDLVDLIEKALKLQAGRYTSLIAQLVLFPLVTVQFALSAVPGIAYNPQPIKTVSRLLHFPTAIMGSGFDWRAYTDQNYGVLQLDVNRCFFHSFFQHHQVSFLSRTCCRWHSEWAKDITPDRHGIRVSRPKSLARGDDCCRFVFDRMQLLRDLRFTPC